MRVLLAHLLLFTPLMGGIPIVDSLSPSVSSGSSQTFVLSVSDSDGYNDLTAIQLLINTAVIGSDACFITWTKWDSALHLVNNVGDNYNNLPAGNSQCSASGTVTGSGNTRQLTVTVTFQASFAGNKVLYAGAQDGAGHNSGWSPMSIFEVAGTAGNPSIASLSPVSPPSSVSTLSVTATDNRGAAYISALQLLVNGSLNGSYSCFVTWTRWDNNVHLVTDAGDNYTNLPLNSAQVLSNGQCEISDATLTTSPYSLTLSVKIVAKSLFAGRRAIWTATQSSDGNNSGWQAKGIWQMLSYGPPSSTCSVGPNPATVNQQQTFASSVLGGVPPYSYTWIGAVSGSGSTKPFTSSGPGSFGATVTVLDAARQSSSSSCVAVTANSGPDFSLVPPEPQLITAGSASLDAMATIAPINGFNSPVQFAWANAASWPPGLQASFSANPSTASTGITIQTTSATPKGTYTLLLTATGSGVTRTEPVRVVVEELNIQPWFDIRLVALDTGDVFGYFAAYTTGLDAPNTKNELRGAVLYGPNGILWATGATSTSWGTSLAEHRSPTFLMTTHGFGQYGFETEATYSYTGTTPVIPRRLNIRVFRDYPVPRLISLSTTSAAPGTSLRRIQIVGVGLGATDLAWSLLKGVTGVSVSGANVAATISPVDRQGDIDYVGNALEFDLTIDPIATPGVRQVRLMVFGTITNPLDFIIADHQPVIGGIQQLGNLSPGSQGYISIYGIHFGPNMGSISICQQGANPCTSQQVSPISIQYWSDTQINALLSASPSASGYYDVAVVSQGMSGSGFVPVPNQTTAQSNRKQIAVSNTSTLSLLVSSNGQQKNPGDCVWIDEDANMPDLKMRVVSNDGQPVTGTATWQVAVSFRQRLQNGASRVLSVNTPSSGPTSPQAAGTDWTAPFSSVFGGDGTILWTYNGAAQQPFTFCLRGRNPSSGAAIARLQSSPYWFAKNISIHETNVSNFCESGRTDGAPYCHNGANPGLPVFGDPAGYGLAQLDTPTPNMSEIWNWKLNADGISALLRLKSGVTVFNGNTKDKSAYQFWLRQLLQAKAYNDSRPVNARVPLPADVQESICTFRASEVPIVGIPNTYWFGDAILMKQYAGAAKNYLSWVNDQQGGVPYWEFNKPTYSANGTVIDANIVREFCTCGTLATCER